MLKPILFNTEMVRAIQEGRKTVTRRTAKPLCGHKERCDGAPWDKMRFFVSPLTGAVYYEDCQRQVTVDGRVIVAPYKYRDILWVRETWGDYSECDPSGQGANYYLYRADFPDEAETGIFPDGTIYDLPRWKPSIHMPKQAARIFLRVTEVVPKRLQESFDEASLPMRELAAEGIPIYEACNRCLQRDRRDGVCLICGKYGQPRWEFSRLWDSTVRKDRRAVEGWAADPWVWVVRFERCERPDGWPE